MNNQCKFESQRTYYPVLGKQTFLNTAQNGLLPTYATEAMNKFLMERHYYALDVITMSKMWDDAEDLRQMIAEMLHAQPNEIVLGSSQSELFNIFSNGIDLQPGDNVVTYDCAYFAMTYTWFNKEKDGVEVRIASVEGGEMPAEKLMSLCDEKTKALTVCHVDFESGYKHDLAKLGSFCREHGILFAVDATQSCGAMNIDVEAMHIDFLSSSTYKWLQCLLGLGFAYINKDLLPTLKQSVIGWVGTKDKLHNDPMVLELSDEARKFECGGLSFIAMEGLKKTVSNYLSLGCQDIEDYILSLTNYVYKRASELRSCNIADYFAPEHRSGIVTLTYPESFGIDRAFLLRNNLNIMLQGSSRCRLALHYYNNTTDIDKFFDILESLEAKQ